MTNGKASVRDGADSTPLLEWIFGALGLVLFVGALGVTILNGTSPDRPAAFTVQVEAPQMKDGRYRVEFETFNAGDITAARVELVAALKKGDTVLESRIVHIEFLPAHSSRRAGVFFTTDPQGLEMTVDAVSYQTP